MINHIFPVDIYCEFCNTKIGIAFNTSCPSSWSYCCEECESKLYEDDDNE